MGQAFVGLCVKWLVIFSLLIFQDRFSLFCFVKCLLVYKRPTLLENHPGGAWH